MNTEFYNSSSRHKIFLFLFFISGFAALLYQVVWQRWLVLYTGIGTVSISLIVSAFMVGLGVGYASGGFIADRSSKSKTILYFVLAEIGIGTFALLSKYIFYDILYTSELLPASNSFLKTYAVLFLSLLFPTFLMGLSLPLLSKGFKLQTVNDQTDYLNLLYFVNTFGAAAGALISGIFLMQLIGLEITVYFGALLNYTIAFISFFVYMQEKRQIELTAKSLLSTKKPEFVWKRSFLFWVIQYFISGFAALSLELLWFRILDNSIKSLSITFSILLGIYLFSMAIGTFTGVKFSQKTNINKTKLFLYAQFLLYFVSSLSIVVFLYSVKHINALSFLSEYFRSYDMKLEFGSLPIIISVYIVLPIFLMSLPTFLMGFSFSISQKIIQDSYAEIGRKIGVLQAVNIAGSTLGTWFVTFVGFKYLGSSLTIKLICSLCIVYLITLVVKKYLNVKMFFPILVLSVSILFLLPANGLFWQILGGVKDKSEIIFNEDETAVSSIVCIKNTNCKSHYVFANGLGQSELPLSVDMIHLLIGAIPALIHSDPKDIAVIGLGSGGTLYGISSRSTTEHIDCFEVITNQPATLKTFAENYQNVSIHSIFSDERISIILKDGRFSIKEGKKKYDIIEADALRPLSAYSGNIYSKEYFTILSKNISEKGIVATWVPTQRVKTTFCEVFPFVFEIDSFLLVGSNSPFNVEKNEIIERFNDLFTVNHFAKGTIDIRTELERVLQNIEKVQTEKSVKSHNVNTDMFPRDEYAYFAKLFKKLVAFD